MGILEPKLKQKFKKPNTPKSKQKLDFCSPRKLKNLRDMFRDMEGGCKTPNVPGGSNMRDFSVGDIKCDSLARTNIPNSDLKDIGPKWIGSKFIDSDRIKLKGLNSPTTSNEPIPVYPARISHDIRAKSPRILSLKFSISENALSCKKKAKKAGESRRLNLPTIALSPTSSPTEGEVRRSFISGWNKFEKVDLNEKKQDTSRLSCSKGNKQIDGGEQIPIQENKQLF